jgi:hypothetical protein
MQKSNSIFLVLLVVSVFACVSTGKKHQGNSWVWPEKLLAMGKLNELFVWADSSKWVSVLHSDDWMKVDSFQQIAQRLMLEFSVDELAFKQQLEQRVRRCSENELADWERRGLVEWRLINGEKRYFKRAASNLKLLLLEQEGLIDGPLEQFCLSHTSNVIGEVRQGAVNTVLPEEFTINYTMTLRADAVPGGSLVKCWMPFPKNLHKRQVDVQLISASESNCVLADDSCLHQSIYMEKCAVAGRETVFVVEYAFRSYAEYYDLRKEKILPYDKHSEVYKSYIAEQAPHVVFSDRIKMLADSICGDETHPYEMVKRIYYWIDNNIPWAGAQEYSVMANIPHYVLDNRRGDCGMQTMLFMALARSRGIPVKWQSGWMLHPEEENLHDWCEVYYQGVGWVPLDVSFNLQSSSDKSIKEFYITGIDAYRLVINDGVGGSFFPPKKFLRSEPWDFQRGEMEWEAGNIYFDQWDYQLQLVR